MGGRRESAQFSEFSVGFTVPPPYMVAERQVRDHSFWFSH